ncbi:unnamed protein product [Nezara viridula]|uniref:Neuropeptide n=1 Tax=Nezara viridula TaxID=85310 RepID=A0A9P0MM54_NEZVI|nr:unnamed protein product [Nezara viridula]
MKVFQVTLLIVGLVAAASSAPKSVIDSLKANLGPDIEDIKIHSKDLIERVNYHLLDDVPVFLRVPYSGSATLVSHFSSDAQDVIDSADSDIRRMKYHIQTAINELYPTDLPITNILQVLTQQLEDARKVTVVKKEQLVQQASSHVLADTSLIAKEGEDAARKTVMGHVNDDFNLYVSNVNDFIAKVEGSVKDAYIKLQKLIYE